MSFALPVERLYETHALLAFFHPLPAYPVHILILPKKAISSLAEMDPQSESEFLIDLFTTVQKLVDRLQLEQPGYRLIVNGGTYQEHPSLHFHLVSGQNAPEHQL